MTRLDGIGDETLCLHIYLSGMLLCRISYSGLVGGDCHENLALRHESPELTFAFRAFALLCWLESWGAARA